MKEKFQKILESMDRKGSTPVVLFAILKMDDLEDKWTIVYADESEVLTDEQRNQIFGNLLQEIRKELTADELSLIARVNVSTISDHLIDSLLNFQTGAKISNAKVNGNFVHEGYIIKSASNGNKAEKSSSPGEADLQAAQTPKRE